MFTRPMAASNDPEKLRFFAIQTAAAVLIICDSRRYDIFEVPRPQGYWAFDPMANLMSGYLAWTDEATYSTSFQTMVEFLYDFVKEQLESDYLLFSIESGARQLIADALSAYQRWKTARIQAERQKLGNKYKPLQEEMGHAAKDWSDLNERFLAL